MSWDLLAMTATRPPARMGELPASWTPDAVLGSADTLRMLISAAFPATDWSDPTFGVLDAGEFAVEFGLGDTDPIDCVGIHVRGNAAAAVDVLLAFAAANTWYFVDTAQNEWLHHSVDVHRGANRFQVARDAIAGKFRGE